MVQVEQSTLSQSVTTVVDVALETVRERTVLSAHDVTDLLLDLRTSLQVQVQMEEAAAAVRAQRPRTAWSTATGLSTRLGTARRPRRHLPQLFRSRP
jgi:hypothetical protein